MLCKFFYDIIWLLSKVDDIGLYLFANKEILSQKHSSETLREFGLLTTDSKLILIQEADPEVIQTFKKKVTETSFIHKSATFKGVSCEIVNSVIGNNVTIGNNVKIQNSIILSDVVI